MNYSIIVYILGWILKLEGAFMLLPCIVAVIYREKAGFSFLFVAAICLALGFATSTKRPKNPNMFAREGFVTVALSWIVLSAFGALPFVINGDIPNYIDAMFEMVSGFTTTGASILHEVEVLNKCSLFWRSFSHWIGGMGVIVFMLAILPMTNGSTMHLMRAETIRLTPLFGLRSRGKPPSRQQIIRPKLRLSQAFHLKWRQRKRHIKSQARNPISLSIWTHYGTIARSCSTKELRPSSLSCAMTNSL